MIENGLRPNPQMDRQTVEFHFQICLRSGHRNFSFLIFPQYGAAHGAVDFFMGLWYDIMYGSMCYGLLPVTGNLKKGEGKYVKPER